MPLLSVHHVLAAQVLPVFFRVRARLASSQLSFTPRSIDFGQVFLNESVAVSLGIENSSPVLQKVCRASILFNSDRSFEQLMFVPRKEVDIQPGNGLLSILPHRKKVRTVTFVPKSATEFKFNLGALLPYSVNPL